MKTLRVRQAVGQGKACGRAQLVAAEVQRGEIGCLACRAQGASSMPNQARDEKNKERSVHAAAGREWRNTRGNDHTPKRGTRECE